LVIKSIKLTDFRNFAHLSLDFDDKGSVFYGKNGSGKTNLLEAISFCAYGKSIRSLTDLDLIKLNRSFFQIRAEFTYEKKSFLFDAAFDRKGRKLIKINNTRLARVSELYRYLKIVYFSQDDINLIEGPPRGRRQFFDMAISQTDFAYIDLLKHYYQLLKQRNALLKNEYLPSEKQAWDKRLIEAAVKIITTRTTYLEKLNRGLKKHYNRIGYDSEDVEIRYNFSFPYKPSNQLLDTFAAEVKRLETDEKRYQRTLLGPHLDDYQFILNKSSINRFGSHGQKRCLAIAVKLSLASMLSSSDPTVLIFDDVLADLDEERAKSIIESLGSKNQIFIATPTPYLYKSMDLPFIDIERIGNRM